MSGQGRPGRQTLDKDLDKLVRVDEATGVVARKLLAPGVALVFLALAAVLASIVAGGAPAAVFVAAAAMVAGYMALNIGANDVANNVGPAVGARVLTMGGALAMAAVFETAGALIAGGDVVETISRGIVDQSAVANGRDFMHAMMAALIAASVWIHLSTWLGAPVSTTHSIVGGVLGAGVAAAGFSAVDWSVVAAISASWVLSPLFGGIVAAAFLAFVKTAIIYQDDKIAAARRWVPVLIAIMVGSFAAYLATKGLEKVVEIGPAGVALLGFGSFLAAWAVSALTVRRQSRDMENRNQSLRRLFAFPLIFSAALLSFAHGANDVANAVGPLAAIVRTAASGGVGEAVDVPFWVMLIGALGISLGLLLFGPRLVRMVGMEITRLNPVRAFCVALAAAVTVIVASWFGMPVSSTHIAVGAVFGVGFFREWYFRHSRQRRAYVERKAARRAAARATESKGPAAAMAKPLAPARSQKPRSLPAPELRRRRLVRRSYVATIVSAWVATVPAAALLAAGIFALLGAVS